MQFAAGPNISSVPIELVPVMLGLILGVTKRETHTGACRAGRRKTLLEEAHNRVTRGWAVAPGRQTKGGERAMH